LIVAQLVERIMRHALTEFPDFIEAPKGPPRDVSRDLFDRVERRIPTFRA
jgi:hypothetical protein